ncbi:MULTISPECIES: hypothetical protein [unclassified Streptomyces]|uniref:hypothetical protein n=1 Tax=unclassified Streptomyces TaxID=2593676 RepID=UPI0033AA9745
MSQPVPPNQQPHGGQPVDGNPYADQQPPAPAGNPYAGQQPPAPTGNPFAGQQPPAPTGNPFAGQQPGQFGGGPFPYAPQPSRNNPGLGLLAALGAAVVAAILYGLLAGSIEREVGYAAVGVGFLIGFAASKAGGPLPAVSVVSAVVALGAVLMGQLIGMAMIVAEANGVGFSEVFFDRFGDLFNAWKELSDFMTYLFLVLGPIGAIGGARKGA